MQKLSTKCLHTSLTRLLSLRDDTGVPVALVLLLLVLEAVPLVHGGVGNLVAFLLGLELGLGTAAWPCASRRRTELLLLFSTEHSCPRG